MTATEDELRAAFAEASALVASAREMASDIVEDAKRRADLMLVEAEAAAAAKRNTGELYLQKARAVLEIAQQRAARAAPIEVVMADDVDEIDVDEPTPAPSNLPSEIDKLLRNAVQSAVGQSLRD